MKIIDVKFNGEEMVFRTNDNGDYLFTGISSNNQISCDTGFHNLQRMKRAIREYLKTKWECDGNWDKPCPRITYKPRAHCW